MEKEIMEKEEYEKPILELISLLGTDIITESKVPEEGDVGEDEQEETETENETKEGSENEKNEWTEDGEGKQEGENSEGSETDGLQATPKESTNDGVQADPSTSGSPLSENLSELLNSILPTSEESYGTSGNENDNSYVEEPEQPEQPVEPTDEGSSW